MKIRRNNLKEESSQEQHIQSIATKWIEAYKKNSLNQYCNITGKSHIGLKCKNRFNTLEDDKEKENKKIKISLSLDQKLKEKKINAETCNVDETSKDVLDVLIASCVKESNAEERHFCTERK